MSGLLSGPRKDVFDVQKWVRPPESYGSIQVRWVMHRPVCFSVYTVSLLQLTAPWYVCLRSFQFDFGLLSCARKVFACRCLVRSSVLRAWLASLWVEIQVVVSDSSCSFVVLHVCADNTGLPVFVFSSVSMQEGGGTARHTAAGRP